jgi:hypothetical protein
MNKATLEYCMRLCTDSLPVYTANVNEADLDRLKSQVPWTGTDRARMTRALEQVLAAGTELASLPAVPLPAEVVAATIALIVHPINHMVACSWCGQKLSLQTEMAGGTEANEAPAVHEVVTPRRLLALTVAAYGQNPVFVENFRNKVEGLTSEG